MANPAIWLIVGLCGAVFGLGMYRLGLRKARPPVRPIQSAPFPLDRMEQLAAQLAHRPAINPAETLAILPHHGCPNVDQWLALVQQQPAEAHQILHALYMQVYRKGVHAAIPVVTSIQAYHATQTYLRDHGPAPALPRPLWEAYPTEAEWRQLIDSDPEQAQRLVHLLFLQQAMFGSLYAPILLQDSLDTYDRLRNS